MTEEEFDALLRRALIDVIHEEYRDILEGDPQVPEHSPAYLDLLDLDLISHLADTAPPED